MTAPSRSRLPVYAAVALLAWVLALVQVSGTFRKARSSESRNAARAVSIAQLEPDAERLRLHAAARAMLIEHAAAGATFDLAGWLATEHASVPKPVVRVETTGQDGAKWARRSLHAEWSAVPLAAFARIVASAEALTPPVRLVSVTVDPVAASGAARVAATFETVGGMP